MALTQVKTLGIEDDAVTLAKQAAGTDGQIITYDASGNPTAVGPGSDGQVLTSTGAGSPPAFETPAAGVGGATGVDFNDDVKIRSGTGNDLEIYHDGSNTYIKNATGDLILMHGAENLAQFKDDGAVELYYDNTKKLSTTSTGLDINGTTTAETWDQNVLIVGTETLALGRAEANNAGPHLHFYKSRNGTWGSNTIVQDDDQLGNIIWYADDGGDYKSPAASIQGAVDGTPGTNDMPGRIVFNTTPDGSETLTERMKIDSSGNVTVSDGDIVIGTAGHGISFAATADGDANQDELFQDYETGTWTPVHRNGVDSPAYSQQKARYTKVGGMVHVDFMIQWGSCDGNGGHLMIGNLPFNLATSHSVSDYGTGLLCYQNVAGGEETVVTIAGGASVRLDCYKKGSVNFTTTNGTSINNTFMIGGFTYQTDS